MEPGEIFAREYVGRLARAARETVQAQVDLARRTADLARSTLAGQMSVGEAGREYLSAVTGEGLRLGAQTGELGRLYLKEVSAIGDALVGAVTADRTGRGPLDPSADVVPPQTTETTAETTATDETTAETTAVPSAAAVSGAVTLRAPVGGVAEGSVVVVNQHPRRRVVMLTADPLRGASGTPMETALEVEPRRVTIPAGAEQSVRLRVPLDTGVEEPGASYVSALHISGGQEATVEVTVVVDT